MKRKLHFLIIVLVAFVALGAQAQAQSRVTLRVVDSASKEAILGAAVELVSSNENIKDRQSSTDYQGKTYFIGVEYGEYTVRVSLMGYKSNSVKYTVNQSSFDMGDIALEVDTQAIEQIDFVGIAMRTSQKGDTLAYNADAYKVTRDADAEALLSKMPGITVTDGVVEAQGETVQKVLIDGRELFGDDVSAAISNIPAEAIKEVEVFNKKSDQAEFSGIDDGDDYKAINIVTRPGMSNGVFGKVYGSYVYDDKYNVGASVNMFQGDRKISAIAMSNNVNQQNFSTDDLLGMVSSGGGRRGGGGSSGMVSSQSGVSTTHALMFNYSEKYSEKVSATANYSFNSSDNVLEEITSRLYTLSADSLQNYNSEYYSNSDNMNHRFSGMLDWTINENNMLMFRPNFSFQDYKLASNSYGETTLTSADISTFVNSIDEVESQDRFGYSISNTIVYRHKFSDNGRSLNLYGTGTWTKNDSDLLSDSYTKYMTVEDSDEDIDQNTITNSSSYSLRANASYMEPLSSKFYLIANYRYNKSYSDTDKRAYMYNPITGGYDDFTSSLSNTYTSDYITQTIGPSLRYNSDMTRFVAEISYQHASLEGNQVYPEINEPETFNTFEDFTYFAMLHHQFSRQSSIRLNLRSSTSTPSVSQLQDVVDTTNPLFISSGNPDLVPTYTNSANVNFMHSNIRRGSTFMAMLSAELQSDYIGQSVTLADDSPLTLDNGVELGSGAQYTEPVNLDGYMNLRGMASFGFPVSFIRSNLNLDLGLTYTQLPSVINSLENTTETFAYSAGAVVGSNISEMIDFTVSYKGAYNVAKNTIQTTSDNTYLSQQASLRMKLEAWWGLTFSVNGSYNQYRGITDDYNEEYTIINAALGKKIFKNRRGEISIGVSDLLNQNTSFVRNVTDTYIENVTSNVLGRMYNVTFTYNLRTYLR